MTSTARRAERKKSHVSRSVGSRRASSLNAGMMIERSSGGFMAAPLGAIAVPGAGAPPVPPNSLGPKQLDPLSGRASTTREDGLWHVRHKSSPRGPAAVEVDAIATVIEARPACRRAQPAVLGQPGGERAPGISHDAVALHRNHRPEVALVYQRRVEIARIRF